ncbi:MAG: PmbA/TldA family metallopeptidase, partial [Actinomycetota bacterium]
MLDDATIALVLAEALGRGGDFAELYVEDRTSTALRLEDSRVEDVSSGRDRGAGVRVAAGDLSAYAYTNVLTAESLTEAARAARAGISDAPAAQVVDLTRVEPGASHPVGIAPDEVGAATKAEALAEAD